MMNQIQRDWQMIKDSEWWHWLKGEIEQQKQSHIARLINATDITTINVLQGQIRALSTLINIIEGPIIKEE